MNIMKHMHQSLFRTLLLNMNLTFNAISAELSTLSYDNA